jgi:hypothetical protein
MGRGRKDDHTPQQRSSENVSNAGPGISFATVWIRRHFLMRQNRTDKQASNRSKMDRTNGGMSDSGSSGSSERMRNRESSSSSDDLGTSSDRAMFADRTSSESRSGSSSSERGLGSSEERNSGSGSARTGGISNRELDQEQCEQEQLPERGRSQSER